MSERFATVIWVPGNHELLTYTGDPLRLRGERRYRHLRRALPRLGVLTPEDPFPLWDGAGGPALVAPLFLLYDYSFGRNVGGDQGGGAAPGPRGRGRLRRRVPAAPRPIPEPRGLVRKPASPRPSGDLTEADPDLPTVLVNHFPLLAEPTRVLRHPEFAQWCGTVRTADWHLRFARRPSSTGTSTSRARPGTTACASRRSRSATRASAGSGRPGARSRGQILPGGGGA